MYKNNEVEVKIDKIGRLLLDMIGEKIDKNSKTQQLTNILYTMAVCLLIVSVSLNMSNANKMQQIQKEKTEVYKKLYKELVRLDLTEITE